MKSDEMVWRAFVSAYGREFASKLSLIDLPESKSGSGKKVEAILSDIQGSTIALEHTEIPPFPGERDEAQIFNKVFADLNDHPDLTVSNHYIYVVIPALRSFIGHNWQDLKPAVKNGLRRIVGEAPEGVSSRQIMGLPFSLTVVVHKHFDDSPFEKGILFLRKSEADATIPVLKTALEEKLPKLWDTGAEKRFLILECRDSNAFYGDQVPVALRNLLAEFPLLNHTTVWLAHRQTYEQSCPVRFREAWPAESHHLFSGIPNG